MSKRILKEVLLEWSKLRWFFFAGAMFYFSFVSVFSDPLSYTTLYSVKAVVAVLFFLLFPAKTKRAPFFSYLPFKTDPGKKNAVQSYICKHALLFALVLFGISIVMEAGVLLIKCVCLHKKYVAVPGGITALALFCYAFFLFWLTLGWWHTQIFGSSYPQKKRGKIIYISSLLWNLAVFALFDANAMMQGKESTVIVWLFYAAGGVTMILQLIQNRQLIRTL